MSNDPKIEKSEQKPRRTAGTNGALLNEVAEIIESEKNKIVHEASPSALELRREIERLRKSVHKLLSEYREAIEYIAPALIMLVRIRRVVRELSEEISKLRELKEKLERAEKREAIQRM